MRDLKEVEFSLFLSHPLSLSLTVRGKDDGINEYTSRFEGPPQHTALADPFVLFFSLVISCARARARARARAINRYMQILQRGARCSRFRSRIHTHYYTHTHTHSQQVLFRMPAAFVSCICIYAKRARDRRKPRVYMWRGSFFLSLFSLCNIVSRKQPQLRKIDFSPEPKRRDD